MRDFRGKIAGMYERWADEPSLVAHFAGPWYRSALSSGLGPPALCSAGPAREAAWLTKPSASTIA